MRVIARITKDKRKRRRTDIRYVLRYIIRRLIRYAKYAAVGGVAALLGGSILGTLGSGVAFFAAPGLLCGMGLGLAGGLAKVCLFPPLSSPCFIPHSSSFALFRPRLCSFLPRINVISTVTCCSP
jgi:hypothetical protein